MIKAIIIVATLNIFRLNNVEKSDRKSAVKEKKKNYMFPYSKSNIIKPHNVNLLRNIDIL
jgi:hypothetical protein